MRIVSLWPSISDTLSRLGLEESIIGVTPYCLKYLRSKHRVIGSSLDIKSIETVIPTLFNTVNLTKFLSFVSHSFRSTPRVFPVLTHEYLKRDIAVYNTESISLQL